MQRLLRGKLVIIGANASAVHDFYDTPFGKFSSLLIISSAVLTINKADIAVTGVSIEVKNAVANTEIKVASLASNPIAAAAAAKVYQYLQLTKSNIADADASKITINFKVPKSWLTANNIDKNTIALNRYDSAWAKLPTTIRSEDSTYVYFTATSPGFSTFAITGSKGASFFDVINKIDAYYKGTATFFDVIGVIDLYYKTQGVVA